METHNEQLHVTGHFALDWQGGCGFTSLNNRCVCGLTVFMEGGLVDAGLVVFLRAAQQVVTVEVEVILGRAAMTAMLRSGGACDQQYMGIYIILSCTISHSLDILQVMQ